LLVATKLCLADGLVGASTTEYLNRRREANKKLIEVAERELSEATGSASVSELETAMLNARESLPLFFCLIESHIFLYDLGCAERTGVVAEKIVVAQNALSALKLEKLRQLMNDATRAGTVSAWSEALKYAGVLTSQCGLLA